VDENVKNLPGLINPLLALCQAAGELICGYYHAPGVTEHRTKADDSPLTRADTESHSLLCAGLAELAPAVPVLSEESDPAELAGRRGWHRFWLVDPLDGTKEFLARTGEFTINIALIDGHRPVLGVLYLPLEQLAYVGIPGRSAHCYRAGGIDRDGKQQWSRSVLATRDLEEGSALRVLASRRHRNRRLEWCLAWLGEHWGPLTRLNSGSALKFCQLAEGGGDFYPRFSPCCEWDTAAGQAVLEAAGGALLGMDGEPLRYNCRDSLLSPHFYAIGDADHRLWRQLLQSPMI
jgi:3'(2'), 5'-bisphosphate nucleotidase